MQSADNPRKHIRCAIYCRKSSEEGLDQAFNSLDAQQEACAAYILSHRHEGWTQVQQSYSDGGYSGGTLERPALRKLLDDVVAGRVDLIIVYKIDRLTRSLADFAKIVDVLDQRAASFVSVTQSFNTSTSMGRLTLNVLLSFAQFEREVTGERIRDKIAASKRKGMWMGGAVPLGYKVEDRKLVVIPDDAATVLHIFQRYVVLGSGKALVEELRTDGYRTRVRQLSTRTVGGIPFATGMLFHMLSNRVYLGKITHRGEAHSGEHEPIIGEALWEQVQQRIAANRVVRVSKSNVKSPSLLAGILYDGEGRRMSPSHSAKGGRQYRYYQTRPDTVQSDGPMRWSLPAAEIDRLVVMTVEDFLGDNMRVQGLVSKFVDNPEAIARALATTYSMKQELGVRYSRHILLGALLRRVQVFDERLDIEIDATAFALRLGVEHSDKLPPIALSVPITRLRRRQMIRLVFAQPSTKPEPDQSLIELLCEARTTQLAFRADPSLTITMHSRETGQCRKRVTRLLRLSWLSPEITRALLDGRDPVSLTTRNLLALDVPVCWSAQFNQLGLA